MPPSREPFRSRRRLARSLLLSLVVHGGLLIGFDAPLAVRFSPPAPPIMLRWRVTAPPPGTGVQLRTPAPTSARAGRRRPTGAIAQADVAVDGAALGPLAPQRDLLESARWTARDEGMRIERHKRGDGLRRQSPEGRLTQVLAQPQAGETLLANGTYRITTPAGVTYCLNEAPAYQRGGISEALRIASTCP